MLMKFSKKIAKRIKSLDSFGKNINLRHLNKDNFKTAAGGIATIVAFSVMIAHILYLSLMSTDNQYCQYDQSSSLVDFQSVFVKDTHSIRNSEYYNQTLFTFSNKNNTGTPFVVMISNSTIDQSIASVKIFSVNSYSKYYQLGSPACIPSNFQYYDWNELNESLKGNSICGSYDNIGITPNTNPANNTKNGITVQIWAQKCNGASCK